MKYSIQTFRLYCHHAGQQSIQAYWWKRTQYKPNSRLQIRTTIWHLFLTIHGRRQTWSWTLRKAQTWIILLGRPCNTWPNFMRRILVIWTSSGIYYWLWLFYICFVRLVSCRINTLEECRRWCNSCHQLLAKLLTSRFNTKCTFCSWQLVYWIRSSLSGFYFCYSSISRRNGRVSLTCLHVRVNTKQSLSQRAIAAQSVCSSMMNSPQQHRRYIRL